MTFSEKTHELITAILKKHPYTKLTVGVLKDGEKSFKLFDRTGEIPYQEYFYEIGSITKVFTTSLLAKYLQAGKMNLDDSIATYISELDDNKYYPTLKRLATHSSGYPTEHPANNYFWEYYEWNEMPEMIRYYRRGIKSRLLKRPTPTFKLERMTLDKMIHFAKKEKLEDKDYPWAYSNFGIALLGLAISRVADRPFWD